MAKIKKQLKPWQTMIVVFTFIFIGYNLVSAWTNEWFANKERTKLEQEVEEKQKEIDESQFEIAKKHNEIISLKQQVEKYRGLTEGYGELCLLRKQPIYNRVIEVFNKYKLIPDNETTKQEFYGKLLFFTCVVESNGGRHLDQLSGGPGSGYYQIEPSTHDDIYTHYFRYNKQYEKITLSSFDKNKSEKANLRDNFEYQTCIAFYQYQRLIDASMIGSDYIEESETHTIAKLWKTHWNTRRGKGDIKISIKKYNEFINNVK